MAKLDRNIYHFPDSSILFGQALKISLLASILDYAFMSWVLFKPVLTISRTTSFLVRRYLLAMHAVVTVATMLKRTWPEIFLIIISIFFFLTSSIIFLFFFSWNYEGNKHSIILLEDGKTNKEQVIEKRREKTQINKEKKNQ